jgi:hypothetical protein
MKHNQAREERIRWFSKGNRTQKNRTRDIGPSSAAVDMPESYHQQLILRCVSCRTGPVLMDAYLAEMQHRWNTHISRQNIPCHTDMKLMQWRRPDENGKYKQADDVWMERECLQHVVGLSIFEKGPSVFSTYLRRYEKSRSSELSEFVDLGDRPRELHQYLVNGKAQDPALFPPPEVQKALATRAENAKAPPVVLYVSRCSYETRSMG